MTSNICVAGSKKGTLTVLQAVNGKILAEVDAAHYMEITDLDISNTDSDMIVTCGKDCKVKVWMLSTLIQNDPEKSTLSFVEFGDNQQEVT